jgi:outer membrane cobalamin receptor
MANVAVAGHLSYTDIEVKDSTTTLRQRPDWRGGVNVHWTPLENVELRLDWLYVGESFDSSIPTGDMTLDGYHRVDASVSWLPTDRLRFWLALDNAFDQDYQQAIGFPSAGVRGRLGVRFTL